MELAGATPERTRTAPEFEGALLHAEFAIIDLTARAYDPLAAIDRASSRGVHVLAVGQHDDVDQRKQALARGAEKVLAYRKLFEDGPATIEAWLDRAPNRAASA